MSQKNAFVWFKKKIEQFSCQLYKNIKYILAAQIDNFSRYGKKSGNFFPVWEKGLNIFPAQRKTS